MSKLKTAIIDFHRSTVKLLKPFNKIRDFCFIKSLTFWLISASAFLKKGSFIQGKKKKKKKKIRDFCFIKRLYIDQLEYFFPSP